MINVSTSIEAVQSNLAPSASQPVSVPVALKTWQLVMVAMFFFFFFFLLTRLRTAAGSNQFSGTWEIERVDWVDGRQLVTPTSTHHDPDLTASPLKAAKWAKSPRK